MVYLSRQGYKSSVLREAHELDVSTWSDLSQDAAHKPHSWFTWAKHRHGDFLYHVTFPDWQEEYVQLGCHH